MKQQKFWTIIFMIILMIAQFILAVFSLHSLVIHHNIASFLETQQTNITPHMIDMVGILIVFIILMIVAFLAEYKNIPSFFRLTVLYFAFIPIIDLNKFIHLFDGHNILLMDFNLANNLILLSLFPKELVMIMIIMGCLCYQNHIKISKTHIIILLTCTLLCFGMLFLPDLSELILYSVSLILIIVAHNWFEKVCTFAPQKYEILLIWACTLLLFGRSIYRMLSILQTYPIN